MSNLFFIFLSALFTSLVIILVLKKVFYRFSLLDNPIKYEKKRAPIPYSMGVVFFLSFFIISYLFIEHDYKLYLLWWFWWLITLISFVDDRINISPKLRLLIQIIIGAIIGLTAIKVGYISNIFWWIIDLNQYFIQVGGVKIYIISLVFTISWYVFIFNAVNWTDGIGGNTSGLSIINFVIIFLLGMKLYFTDTYQWGIENAIFIMSLSVALVGILIPFFYFDVKQKILMWDSGTMFLGFMLASTAIISWWKIATVLLVFWVYSIDAVYVIIKRILNKKNPLKGDFTHLHHRLSQKHISEKHILVIIFLSSFIFWITSLFLDKIWKMIVFVIITFFVIFIPKILSEYKNNDQK